MPDRAQAADGSGGGLLRAGAPDLAPFAVVGRSPQARHTDRLACPLGAAALKRFPHSARLIVIALMCLGGRGLLIDLTYEYGRS